MRGYADDFIVMVKSANATKRVLAALIRSHGVEESQRLLADESEFDCAIDEYSRECVLLRSARSFPARRVIDCLEELLVTTGRRPEWLRSDNGPEFVAAKVQQWLATAGVGSAYITPGSPWENGHVESFHASLRPELLDRELFFTMKEVAVRLEDWRHLYNHIRPHGSLSNKPPVPQKNKIAISPTTTKKHLQNSH